MELCLAIDFGTSNSLAAAASPGHRTGPLPLDPLAPDPTILRSVLYSPARQQWEYGEEAIRQYYDHGADGRIFRSLKKFLPDPSFQGTQVHGVYYSLEDLLGRLLAKIRSQASAALGQDLKRAMIGHPALFAPDAERHQKALARLEKAARLAGFEELAFCPEPVAAAYEFVQTLTSPKTVLIADFGGGTSDFTVVRMRPEGFRPEDVLAIGGLSIAGDAFDGSIMEHLVAPHFGSKISYRVPFGSNILSLPKGLVRKMCSPADLLLLARQEYTEFFRQLDQWSLGGEDAACLERLNILIEERQGYQLFQSIEEAKKGLSGVAESRLNYTYPTCEIDIPLPKDSFRSFSEGLVESICKALDETMKDAGVSYEQVDLVCCTGGTARLDAVQEALEKRLGRAKLQEHQPFHAVIQGLAVRAQELLVKGS